MQNGLKKMKCSSSHSLLLNCVIRPIPVHFVWNIAERLGSKKDYTGRVRADFIKRMFPDVMRDIEQDSIRNFKFQPDTGNIVIDEPDKGDYHFHILPVKQ